MEIRSIFGLVGLILSFFLFESCMMSNVINPHISGYSSYMRREMINIAGSENPIESAEILLRSASESIFRACALDKTRDNLYVKSFLRSYISLMNKGLLRRLEQLRRNDEETRVFLQKALIEITNTTISDILILNILRLVLIAFIINSSMTKY